MLLPFKAAKLMRSAYSILTPINVHGRSYHPLSENAIPSYLIVVNKSSCFVIVLVVVDDDVVVVVVNVVAAALLILVDPIIFSSGQ